MRAGIFPLNPQAIERSRILRKDGNTALPGANGSNNSSDGASLSVSHANDSTTDLLLAMNIDSNDSTSKTIKTRHT